jgi:hypothetical protein
MICYYIKLTAAAPSSDCHLAVTHCASDQLVTVTSYVNVARHAFGAALRVFPLITYAAALMSSK